MGFFKFRQPFRVLVAAGFGLLVMGAVYLRFGAGRDAIEPEAGGVSANVWVQAKRNIKYRPPSDFAELPGEFIEELVRDGCQIPQPQLPASGSYRRYERFFNVVEGDFARHGQRDWAVLCSRNGVSEIRFYWGGKARCPSPIASFPDLNFLQVATGDGDIYYSRNLAEVTNWDSIKFKLTRALKNKTPKITHDALADNFLDKGGTVFYCHEGKWLEGWSD